MSGPAPSAAAAAFIAETEAALAAGTPERIADESMRGVLTALIRLYAAKSERAEAEPEPFAADAVTATEAVTLACGVIRGAGLNLFDVAMWYGRPAAGL